MTAILSFTLFSMLAIMLARALNGSLVEPSPMIRGLGFLSAWFATLASLLLTLPAPHWLGTATPGRHAALLLLALVASAGVSITMGTSPRPAAATASALR